MALDTIRGVLEVKWDDSAGAPTLAAPKIATELNTWVDALKGTGDGECIQSMDGWGITPGFIDVPNACSKITGKIAGETDLGEPTITYYLDDTTTSIRDMLAVGTAGYMCWMVSGETVGYRSQVDQLTVIENQVDYTVDNAPATWTVKFSRQAKTEGLLAT